MTQFNYSSRALIANQDRTPDNKFFSYLVQVFEKCIPFSEPSDNVIPIFTLASLPTTNMGTFIIVSDGAAGQKLRAWNGSAYVA